MYCLMVNNCTVSSERDSSQKVPILDEFGCSLFPNVLPHVEYPSDLNGGLLVNAFSLDVDQQYGDLLDRIVPEIADE
ncbi:hypothetical protein TELCIR_03799 [Teladorsagia circumcincta]|uniref:ZP domain-containing protein n=1 Tax=Teladorsagia circumcincta TaxID=45464 RepID=A0A2G9UVB5_TELCI|nr:hypothetical protein TELCIR_03799 [Teladorsagia circumcincta]